MGYTRLSAQADIRIPTFFRRRTNPHFIGLRVLAGRGLGDVPAQRLGIVDGRNGPFASFGTLRTVDLPFEGSRWGGIVWTYDVGRALFESLGLGIPTGLALHGGHAWTSDDTGRSLGFDLRTVPGGHHELGLSFVRPMNFPVRFDLTRRLGEPGWFFTLGVNY